MSVSETQPLSVLQAMASQKPILLLRASYTRDAPFRELSTITSTNGAYRFTDDGAQTGGMGAARFYRILKP